MACPGGTCSLRNRSSGGSVGASMPPQRPSLPSVGAQATRPPQAGFFKGTNDTFGTAPRLTQEQIPLFMQVLQQALGQLQGIPGQDQQFGFGPIQEDITRQFYQETVPTLAERFTAMGHGAQNSSAFQGALGKAGADLGSALASLRAQYGLQQQGLQNQRLSTLLGAGLGQQRENVYFPGQSSGIANIGSALFSTAPRILTSLASSGYFNS